MLSKYQIETIMSTSARQLATIFKSQGEEAAFETCKFVGLNQDGHFVFDTTFPDECDTVGSVKVFVQFNHETETLSADY